MKKFITIFFIIFTFVNVNSFAQTEFGIGVGYESLIAGKKDLFFESAPIIEAKLHQGISEKFSASLEFGYIMPYLINKNVLYNYRDDIVQESDLTLKYFRTTLGIKYLLPIKESRDKFRIGINFTLFSSKLDGRVVYLSSVLEGDEKYTHQIGFGPEVDYEIPLNDDVDFVLTAKYTLNKGELNYLHWLQIGGGIKFNL